MNVLKELREEMERVKQEPGEAGWFEAVGLLSMLARWQSAGYPGPEGAADVEAVRASLMALAEEQLKAVEVHYDSGRTETPTASWVLYGVEKATEIVAPALDALTAARAEIARLRDEPASPGMPGRLYARRDAVTLGPLYAAHVSAMTAEGLHEKSAIAAELAWRDAEIATLKAQLAEASPQPPPIGVPLGRPATLAEQRAHADAHGDEDGDGHWAVRGYSSWLWDYGDGASAELESGWIDAIACESAHDARATVCRLNKGVPND